MKAISHNELLNEIVGQHGTAQRTEFENELKADVLAFKFKKLRKQKQLTQTELANSLGMEKGQISKIENGKFNLTLATINKIAAALGVSINFDFQTI